MQATAIRQMDAFRIYPGAESHSLECTLSVSSRDWSLDDVVCRRPNMFHVE